MAGISHLSSSFPFHKSSPRISLSYIKKQPQQHHPLEKEASKNVTQIPAKAKENFEVKKFSLQAMKVQPISLRNFSNYSCS